MKQVFAKVDFSCVVLTAIYAMIFVLAVTGCGKSSTDAGVTSLAQLPKAIGPVVSGGAAVRSARAAVESQASALAVTGQSLANFGTPRWEAKDSEAFCQVGNMVRNLVREAGQPDKILCYVGIMEANGLFTGSYDGTDKFYRIRMTEHDFRQEMRIKTNIGANAGRIETFKMYMCNDGRTSNDEYVSQDLRQGAQVVSVSRHDFGGSTGAQRTAVSGNVDGKGRWTSKKIVHGGTYASTYEGNAFSFQQHLELDQGVDRFDLSGYFIHSNTFYGAGTGRVRSVVQGLNLGSLVTAALGDGSAKGLFSHDPGIQSVSWNGDTRQDLADPAQGAYYPEVLAADLIEIGTPDVTFKEGETWDCQGGFVDLDLDAIRQQLEPQFRTCDETYGFGANEGWVECRGTH